MTQTTPPSDKKSIPQRRALGKGLDSLLPRVQPRVESHVQPNALPDANLGAEPQSISTIAAEEESDRSIEIPLFKIDRNPFQTRMYFDEKAIEELSHSIQSSGVLQPILVRPIPQGRYQLIAGERRWKAAKLAGLRAIPALVRAVADEQVMEITIIENLQRADLNPLEQAMAFNRLSRQFGLNQELIALRTGKDRTTISNYMRLLQLPPFAQDKITSGELSFGHAKVILSLDTEPQMEEATRRVLSAGLSVRQTEAMVRTMRFGAHDPIQALPQQPRRFADTPSTRQTTDPNVAAAEQRLRDSLGMRVKIEDKAGAGRIILEYANLDDFDSIMARLAV